MKRTKAGDRFLSMPNLNTRRSENESRYPDIEPIDYDEMARETCAHEFVSWHGSRGECQECGAAIPGRDNEDTLPHAPEPWT